MSKKLAAGADAIVLDVKTGSGAFMKTVEDSIRLAQAMVAIGEHTGRRTVALITDMDRPLGFAIGNSLEVCEAVETLRGRGPEDLTAVCLELAANMLCLGGLGDIGACRALAREALENGRAFEAFCRMAAAQGGDASYLTDPAKFARASVMRDVAASESGWLTAMDTEAVGESSVVLGAGRETKDSPIDFSAGILLRKKPGDRVEKGDVIATLCTNDEKSAAPAAKRFLAAVRIGGTAPAAVPLIHARVDAGGVERFTEA